MPEEKRSTPARRALRMAAMSAGVAGSYVGYLLQRSFLGEDKREAKLKSAHTRAAKRMRDEMQSLRGPAMKLGQAMSLQAGILPDETLAELASLQMEAPGMHPSLVRAQFKSSMGRYPEDVYASFEPEPFAAASLGQVHHATLQDGTDVAVKIQYPGIHDAIAHDFKWFRAASKPAQASGHIPRAAIDELEEQITAETDYTQEADNTEFFAKRLAPLEYVSVPRVYRKLSSAKVITMSLLGGQHLDRFLARRPSQSLRNEVGERLFRLYYFQLLRVGAFHADPHWGNYLFGDDGSIGLVDFGCVKRLKPAFVRHLHEVYLFDGARDGPAFKALLERRYAALDATVPEAATKALMRFAQTFYASVYPPHADTDHQTFDFADPAFLKSYMRESQNMGKAKGVLPEYLMIARAESGLYHTLHRLRAKVHTSRIVREYLDR